MAPGTCYPNAQNRAWAGRSGQRLLGPHIRYRAYGINWQRSPATAVTRILGCPARKQGVTPAARLVQACSKAPALEQG